MGRVLMEIDPDEIRRILAWAYNSDGETFLNEEDWPLIVKLATTIDADPAASAPNLARELREPEGLDEALRSFANASGHWPTVDEQAAIRDRLEREDGIS